MKILFTVYNYFFRPWKRMMSQSEFMALSVHLTAEDYVVYCAEFYDKSVPLAM